MSARELILLSPYRLPAQNPLMLGEADVACFLNASTEWAESAPLLDTPPETIAAFFAIGFGHRTIETLFEAMEHENTLASADFWQDIQSAVAALNDPDPQAYRRQLQAAADRLLAA